MSRPVRVALVGFGWAGQSIWLPRLTAHPSYRVVTVVDPDPRSREVAAEREGLAVLDDLDRLDPSDVDLAVVTVPNHLHSPVACRLLERGIPVFLEKPVCLDVAEADRLAIAEREGGAVLLAGSAANYRADVRALHELAAELRPVRHVELSWVRARGVPGAGGWFTNRELAGGGALVDLGWHLLDIAGPLVGRAVFEQVAGTVSADFVNNPSLRAAWREEERGDQPAGDVEDTVRAFVVTGSGVSVSLRASWASHEARDTTRITVEGAAGSVALSCTFGFSTNRLPDSVLTRTHNGVTAPVPVAGEQIGAEYTRQLDELPALLADPASRGAAIAQARATIEVIERIYASARQARPSAGVLEVRGA
ncbi:oxidoreductase [Saccharopolyspora erythraea NRRL 2338]|uniref:Oxidoreductase n=2 Tax=Saccharopolyspora erythraea TaxID=1836 RepID=A4FDM4_SACEN|nr:Gfo/Idh/MocA family oxidoreductase [Saccharopolyspora erythraea]EQD85689.1 oxidoreductase [Saccharopolyspora erythraea D]PFG95884.1 oxidoreductase [Saccharopolyspora erythraea NRRL 2338]QRK92459.1 Gfo/Idh/MocA family oxidoreductase [Saccharopolyspora erythraea]CAM02149.1 putative oxidoreductase [Saccharopolyspora erythraea NRRL 2338]